MSEIIQFRKTHPSSEISVTRLRGRPHKKVYSLAFGCPFTAQAFIESARNPTSGMTSRTRHRAACESALGGQGPAHLPHQPDDGPHLPQTQCPHLQTQASVHLPVWPESYTSYGEHVLDAWPLSACSAMTSPPSVWLALSCGRHRFRNRTATPEGLWHEVGE